MATAIDDLLNVVSDGDIEHEIYGARYEGSMDDEEFFGCVYDYLVYLKGENERLKKELQGYVDYTAEQILG